MLVPAELPWHVAAGPAALLQAHAVRSGHGKLTLGSCRVSRGLQKSYSFDNVSFAAGELTCDAKDVGEVQKHMAKLQGELANDMAK